MSFVFSLQKVEEHRKRLAEDAERQVELARIAIKQLRDELENEKLKYFEERQQLNELVRVGEIQKIKIYENSLELRKKRMMELIEAIRSLENELEFLLVNLSQARKNLKAIEKLHEQKKEKFEKSELQKEAKEMDFIAQIKASQQLNQKDDE